MDRKTIKTAIKNEVDDQTIDDAILNEWLQTADDRIQTWRPANDQNQTFDYWDYLKDTKNYAGQANINKYGLPDEYRGFIELVIGDDTEPYKLIDYRERNKYTDHAIWILGRYFYIKATPSESGKTIVLAFVRFSEPFASDSDEPEIERIYHSAYVAFGKAMYYNQQGDTELENQNLNQFEKIMVGKWRDQELNRMTAASDQAEIPKSSLV